MCIQELGKVRLAMYLLVYTHTVAILHLVFTLDIRALLEGFQRVLSHTETSGGESPGWFVYSTLSIKRGCVAWTDEVLCSSDCYLRVVKLNNSASVMCDSKSTSVLFFLQTNSVIVTYCQHCLR